MLWKVAQKVDGGRHYTQQVEFDEKSYRKDARDDDWRECSFEWDWEMDIGTRQSAEEGIRLKRRENH